MMRLIITLQVLIMLLHINLAHAEQLLGVNISGAELNNKKIPGRHAFDYIWPNEEDINKSANAGFTVIRVPFLWERMQMGLGGPLNEQELMYLDRVVAIAKMRNIKVILDPHNYGGYLSFVIGAQGLKAEYFQDFWKKLATRYSGSPNVIFGLMNEPFKQTPQDWAQIAQAAVTAIRETGATQLILVPGTYWSGAHSWLNRDNNPSNAEALATLVDPLNNYAYEMHQYFDADSSGTHANCMSENVGVERLLKATAWLKAYNKKAFLGEFGASSEPTCLQALNNTLDYLKQNQDVWVGWTYWAAGKWWGNYMFSIESMNARQSPQFSVIKKYLSSVE